MIGVFVLFGNSATEVFPAILTYRLFAFWLPIAPGALAFASLRRTVARWDEPEEPLVRAARERSGGERAARDRTRAGAAQ